MPKFLKALIAVLTITIILIYGGYSSFLDKPIFKQDKIITIEKGNSFSSLSDKLNINNFYFKIYLNKNKPSFNLQAGKYKINSGATINEVIKSLDKPALVDEIKLTFLEGWNIYDVDDYLTQKSLIKKGDYINYTTSNEKILKLTKFYNFIYPGLNTLEGYLYPDTYKIDKNNFAINKIIIKQLDNFENKVYNKILIKYTKTKIQEILKLASIVEKEERSTKNKPIVAGILKKRLNNSWPIGADITVCYPHELTSEQCKMVVSKYIREKNKYNTRTMTGLPKTPIGNPSYETIKATINDTKTSYWYYLHDTKTGQIYYATDNTGHEKNKRLYLR